MTEIAQDQVSILNYLKVFFRRKELLIIPAFFGLVLGICSGVLMPKKFISTTVILVEEGKTDNPLFDNLAVSTSVRERLATIKESMLGWNSLVELVKRLGLTKDIKTNQQFENLILGIRNDIDIKLRGNNIIYLAYIGKDPVQTQAVVENITNIFIERNRQIQDQETEDAIAFIEEQLKVYEGKIKSADIAKLQDQLDDLLQDSTDKHPLVRQLREKIDLAKKELDAKNLEYTKPERLNSETTNPIIDSIKKALDVMDTKGVAGQSAENSAIAPEGADKDLYKLVLIDKLENVMARDAKVNESIYNVLLQRLETAKITKRLQKSKEGTRYTVLDPPRVPLAPFKPNRMIISMLGLFAGLMLGFALVVGTEFLDKSFIDVEDAKEFLGVPLLGAISKITTEDSLRQEKEQQRWMYSLTVVAGLLLVVITLTMAEFLK